MARKKIKSPSTLLTESRGKQSAVFGAGGSEISRITPEQILTGEAPASKRLAGADAIVVPEADPRTTTVRDPTGGQRIVQEVGGPAIIEQGATPEVRQQIERSLNIQGEEDLPGRTILTSTPDPRFQEVTRTISSEDPLRTGIQQQRQLQLASQTVIKRGVQGADLTPIEQPKLPDTILTSTPTAEPDIAAEAETILKDIEEPAPITPAPTPSVSLPEIVPEPETSEEIIEGAGEAAGTTRKATRRRRGRRSTILTSALGVTGPPSVRRATLLGG
jgi:hypothetical protein